MAFDSERATMTGLLPEPSLRRASDRRLDALWFLAVVENRIEIPTTPLRQLVRLGAIAGPAQRITPLGRWFDEVPVEARRAAPCPCGGRSGSSTSTIAITSDPG
jgi:hypothetical protein